MNVQEVMVRLGLDNTALQNGLMAGKQKLDAFTHHIKASFADAFHHLLAPLSVGGLIVSLERVMERVKNIKRISESVGLDESITQDLLNLGKATGIADAGIEKMLDKFAQGLKPGSDPEEALFAFADKLAKIEDPGERARMAVEQFGKAGVKLVPILAQGSDGVKKLSEQFGKLDEAQVDAIEHAHIEMQKAGGWFTKLLGAGIEGGQDMWHNMKEAGWKNLIPGYAVFKTAFGDNAGRENPDEVAGQSADKAARKQAILAEKQRQEHEDALKAAVELETYQRRARERHVEGKEKEKLLTLDLLEARREYEDLVADGDKENKRFEILKNIADTEGEIAATQEKAAKDAIDAQTEVLRMKQLDAQQARQDRTGLEHFMPSIEELAKSGHMTRGGFRRGPFANDAQSILNWEKSAKIDFENGNVNWAKQDIDQRNMRYDRLANLGIVAMRPEIVAKAQIEMEKHIRALVEQKAKIKIIPENGK